VRCRHTIPAHILVGAVKSLDPEKVLPGSSERFLTLSLVSSKVGNFWPSVTYVTHVCRFLGYFRERWRA